MADPRKIFVACPQASTGARRRRQADSISIACDSSVGKPRRREMPEWRAVAGVAPPLSQCWAHKEHFQFETLRVSSHTACRFAEKTRFFRSLWAGRRCAAASRFTFFKVEALKNSKRPPGERTFADGRTCLQAGPRLPGDGCRRGSGCASGLFRCLKKRAGEGKGSLGGGGFLPQTTYE